MPNYFTTVTAEIGLKATRDEYEALEAALYSAEYNGWGGDYDDEEVCVCARRWGSQDLLRLPRLLGGLIAENGLEYLEFGAACRWTGRMGSDGGALPHQE